MPVFEKRVEELFATTIKSRKPKHPKKVKEIGILFICLFTFF
jgi:hypothetical protein